MKLQKNIIFSNLMMHVRRQPFFVVSIIVIFLVALFLRTYAYLDRIYFYADSTLFVQAAYFAKENLKIPQIGPFAQGPFFTGPWWLWILAISFIFPLGILTPWYFMTLVSFIFIILIYVVGKEIGGKWLGILSAFFAGISTAQVDNSFMTWNASADPILGLLAVLFFLKYIKNNKPLDIFLLSFTISLAISIHFQTAFLGPLIIVAFFTRRPKLKNIFALIAGFMIPLLPFLYFDIRFHWFETRRIYDYMTVAQYRMYVPNRWLTYAGIFWPQTWSWIIGGAQWFGYILIGLVAFMSLLKLREFKKHTSFFLILLAFAISVIMLRFYRGERQFYYTNYAHAYVLLLTAWTCFFLYKFNKAVGILLISLITFFTIKESVLNISPRIITYRQTTELVSDIYKKYPGSSFDIYECPFQSSLISTAVSYQMYFDGRNSLSGKKIGVCNENFIPTWREVKDEEVGGEYRYQNKSVEKIYTDMTEWWIKNPPTEDLY